MFRNGVRTPDFSPTGFLLVPDNYLDPSTLRGRVRVDKTETSTLTPHRQIQMDKTSNNNNKHFLKFGSPYVVKLPLCLWQALGWAELGWTRSFPEIAIAFLFGYRSLFFYFCFFSVYFIFFRVLRHRVRISRQMSALSLLGPGTFQVDGFPKKKTLLL